MIHFLVWSLSERATQYNLWQCTIHIAIVLYSMHGAISDAK